MELAAEEREGIHAAETGSRSEMFLNITLLRM